MLHSSCLTIKLFSNICISSPTNAMPDRSEQGVKRGRAATPPTVTPAAKRASIIEQIREAPNYAKDPREINSPDDLDEFEITECYKVALAAAKSIWPNAKVTSAMMESFLSIIFDNWTSNKSIGTLRIDEDLPEVCNARSNAVGHVPFKLPGTLWPLCKSRRCDLPWRVINNF